MAIINQAVSTGAHDGHAQIGVTVNTTGSLMRAGSGYTGLWHFPSTGIPQGATIASATISMNILASGGNTIALHCEAADNPSNITTLSEYNAITATTASTSWSVAGSGVVSTPDFSA